MRAAHAPSLPRTRGPRRLPPRGAWCARPEPPAPGTGEKASPGPCSELQDLSGRKRGAGGGGVKDSRSSREPRAPGRADPTGRRTNRTAEEGGEDRATEGFRAGRAFVCPSSPPSAGLCISDKRRHDTYHLLNLGRLSGSRGKSTRMCVCARACVSYEAKTRKSKHRSGGEGLLRRTWGARYGSWGRKARRPGCRSPQEDSEGCIWPPSCQGT